MRPRTSIEQLAERVSELTFLKDDLDKRAENTRARLSHARSMLKKAIEYSIEGVRDDGDASKNRR